MQLTCGTRQCRKATVMGVRNMRSCDLYLIWLVMFYGSQHVSSESTDHDQIWHVSQDDWMTKCSMHGVKIIFDLPLILQLYAK